EDGIRDGRVTGVQTCALPIFARTFGSGPGQSSSLRLLYDVVVAQRSPTTFRYNIAVLKSLRNKHAQTSSRRRAGACRKCGPRGRSEERRVGKERRSRVWPSQA